MSFPPVALAEGERIVGVEMIVTCGRFCAVNRIPDDWSVEVASPVSEVTKLKASCGHGAAGLWTVADLDQFVTVCACASDCFDIKGSLVSTVDFEHEVTRAYRRSDLTTSPPNPRLQRTALRAAAEAQCRWAAPSSPLLR